MRFGKSWLVPVGFFALILAAASRPVASGAQPWQEKVDPWVLTSLAKGETEFILFLTEQADLSGAERLKTKLEKGTYVFTRLREVADRTQGPVLSALAARRAEYRPYWVANMVWVRGDRDTVQAMAERRDIAHIYANPTVHFDEPVAAGGGSSPAAIEWNILQIRAPDVWAAGYTGQGAVIGGQDTGYQWSHPALVNKYRGWDGTLADHNYNWHDAIHSGGGVCGANSREPCDDHNHGTHTMGTMVGDDEAGNQIGVAPGARWIGCRNMDRGNGTPTTYSECFQWFIAPTDLDDQIPDPSKAPHVINNSWGCPPSEGCTDPNVLQAVVENTRAAGIVVVVSAGNSGSGCGSVRDPAAIYEASFSVGATNSTDNIAGFSSRGPVTVDGSDRLKPDISAPGVSVRSSIRNNNYSFFSGTSMAGPHVAGLVGLILSAAPGMIGQVGDIEALIEQTAVPRTTVQICGGIPGDQIPNNTYGWGRADAYAALQAMSADLSLAKSGSPDPVPVGERLTYTLLVTNQGPVAATGVALTDNLPLEVTLESISPSQGACGESGGIVTCDLGDVASSASATVEIVVIPTASGIVTNTALVTATQIDLDPANNSALLETLVTE